MGAFNYSFCDVVVTTSLEFPELPLAPNGASSIFAFELIDEPQVEGSKVEWERVWDFPDKSATVFSTETETSGYRYRLDSVHGPRFYVSQDGHRIDCDTWKGDEDAVRHLFADQVMPRVLSYLGSMMVHAACIETPHGTIAIFGESGRGKSTLSYAMQCMGCTVLSDDCVKLLTDGARCQAIPTYRSLRLWPDVVDGLSVDAADSRPVAGYNSKRRIDVTRLNPQQSLNAPRNLTLGIILDDMRVESSGRSRQPRVSLTECNKQSSLVELLRQTFHLNVRDREIQQRSFDRIESLLRKLPFYSLSYPRGLQQLRCVAQELIERLSGTTEN